MHACFVSQYREQRARNGDAQHINVVALRVHYKLKLGMENINLFGRGFTSHKGLKSRDIEWCRDGWRRGLIDGQRGSCVCQQRVQLGLADIDEVSRSDQERGFCDEHRWFRLL